jgi:hypothetical protein
MIKEIIYIWIGRPKNEKEYPTADPDSRTIPPKVKDEISFFGYIKEEIINFVNYFLGKGEKIKETETDLLEKVIIEDKQILKEMDLIESKKDDKQLLQDAFSIK